MYTEDKNFTGINFNDESLQKGDYENCTFENCIFSNTDLSEINFAECEFKNCDLSGAIFENSVLENADSRSSYNYTIDPEVNRINKAKFSLAGVTGLLHKYHIEIE